MAISSEQFLVPEGTYLLSHSVGCLPRAALAAQERFFELWQTRGGNAWDEWLAAVEGFGHSLAALLHGQPGEFCPQTNISSAVSKIVTSLPPRRGKETILISELDFPSVGFALEQAERLGYRIKRLPAEAGRFTADHWQQHLTGDVQMALVTHVLYGNSFCNPVAEIVQAAREREIFTVVDVAQSAGVVPIDLAAWGADFVVGSCIKWLCGGPGAGFLWANSAGIEQFRPLDVGWFSHENPFEFDIRQFRYAPDARRFWGGTPSVLPYMVARAGIDQIQAIGVESIQEHNRALTEQLVQFAQSRRWPLHTPAAPERRGGTVCIGFPDPQKVVAHLEAAQIWVDFRPSFGVRFSPHIYVSQADMTQTIRTLDKISK
ncbi:MAG: aminotransferase class V-fold PLP-dependent enzyme [Chloroflexi bacterium]|nr:aminotransferase class V-fold PLP-dependent enzyme [Chloroflexota bacterium]MCI0578658.1 aminotransferase class V-fold PLP-dependent enzyme [Chloroflexota bacterium]MCI0647231.1 aminotransferase class V-fold PLP-dependent enzyme [Chloroflexota bacterium]MCI0728957.1 aminotransferase class V-fold PLP-dependent enzyme [Chloroflexota bacterium]